MPVKTVVIVNGPPRSGKDTTIEIMCRHLNARGVLTDSFSSIDPVRGMLTGAGFDLSAKTHSDRALLAEVGASVEKHSHWRSRWCVDMTDKLFARAGTGDAVMFLQIREKAIIEHTIYSLVGRRVHKLLVKSMRAETVTSNAADRDVLQTAYDAKIHNDGSLLELERSCETVMFNFGLIDQLSLLS